MNPYYDKNDVLYLSRCTHDQGFFRIEDAKLQFRLFNGDWSPILKRFLLHRQSAIGVLPYDPVRDEVVLIEQFRIGALHDTRSPWLMEIVAGVIDSTDTNPRETAHRETKEETGLDLNHILPISQYWVSPGMSNEYMHLFCGIVDASQAEKICGVEEEGEDIHVHRVPYQRAIHALQQGIIHNAPSIIALQWLQLNRYDLIAKNKRV